MDRFEIVDPGSNGEAVFLEFRPKWLLNSKIAKMAMSRTKQAGSQCTLSKPLPCPKNGETLIKPQIIEGKAVATKCEKCQIIPEIRYNTNEIDATIRAKGICVFT